MAKILVVDDDQAGRESLVRLLSAAGHKTTDAPNGRDALSILLTDRPDVVLLDLVMPEMDGTSFLEVVRSYLRLQSLPVVVLTAIEESPMIAKAQALQVNCVLIKARASSEDILKAVEEAVSRHPG